MLVHEPAAGGPLHRVVVLGAGGFIGRNLTARLEAQKADVLALGSKRLDLTQPDAEAQLCAQLRPSDAVVMLAARAPKKGFDSTSLLKNISMNEAVCRALARVGCGHVVYLSSDSVYPFASAPITEAAAAAPTYLYAAMHLTRELMLKEIVKTRLAILRPTQIYGADDTHNAYGPNRMIRSALAESRIALFGEGEETRDHLCIDDLVTLLIGVLQQRSTGVLNLATGRSIAFAELAGQIAQLSSRPIEIVSQPRQVAITHRQFDTAALRAAFPRFTPIPLAEGLARLMAQLQSRPAVAPAAAS